MSHGIGFDGHKHRHRSIFCSLPRSVDVAHPFIRPFIVLFAQVKDICNELDVRSLCHKILQNVSMLLNADRGSLFLVQGRTNAAGGAATAGGDAGPKR